MPELSTANGSGKKSNGMKIVAGLVVMIVAGGAAAGMIYATTGNFDLLVRQQSIESTSTDDSPSPIDTPSAPSVMASSGSKTPSTVVDPSPITIPTFGPTVSPSDFLSSIPSSSPTDLPTPVPTSTPTSKPTSTPTRNPTQRPTPNPTPDPTQNPTPGPTSPPTPNPTPGPTVPPTSNPTPGPTPPPTRNPTPGPTPPPTRATPNPTPPPTPPPTSLLLNGQSGAMVTYDCLFQDYGYAIDIFWSCGDERFGNALRLHTFKRHSQSHRLIFADQKITFRDGILWFQEYNTPRCIQIRNGELYLRSSASNCDNFVLEGSTSSFQVRRTSAGDCIRTTGCNDDESTGGEECGGLDHRFLPLEMGSCNNALRFRFQTRAEDCTNGRDEYPENACF